MSAVAVAPSNTHRRIAVHVSGAVQGVGFRPFVYRLMSPSPGGIALGQVYAASMVEE